MAPILLYHTKVTRCVLFLRRIVIEREIWLRRVLSRLATLLRLFIAVLVINCGTLGPVFGFSQRLGQSHMEKVAADLFHPSQAKLVEDLSPEESGSLDERFANGLIYFYDGDYHAALAVFAELQKGVDSDRFHYLSALCHYRLGDVAVARRELTSLLEKDPHHHAARVALMELYARSGNAAEAAAQLQYLEDGSIEDNYRMMLDQLEFRTDQQPEESLLYLSVSQSLRWDSNINAGPGKPTITAPDGTVFLLDKEDRAIGDWATTTFLYGWYRYNPASHASLFWDTSASVYHLHHFEYDEYDYTDLRISTGPVWKIPSCFFGLPAGYRKSLEHGNAYSRDVFIEPVFKYTFNNRWAINSTFYYGGRSYAEPVNDGLDKAIRRIDLQPILTLHNTSISAGVGWLSASAHDQFFSYHGVEAYLKASHQWTDRTRMSVGYKHRLTQYQGSYTGWFEKREDETNSIHASVTHNIGKHWSLGASASWSRNHTNTELFEYERFTAGLNVIFKF